MAKVEIIKENGGYFFPQFDIHVLADSKVDAKAKVKEYYGIDVDSALKEMEKAKESADTE